MISSRSPHEPLAWHRLRRWFALWIGVVAVVTVVTPPAASFSGPATPTRVSFSWEMDPRFGLDTDGDGLLEIENTPEYAHNRVPTTCPDLCSEIRLGVTLTAAPSPDAIGLPVTGFLTYEWRISGPAGAGTYHRVQPDLDLLLPEGDHAVDLRVRVRLPWGSVTLRNRGSILVDDLLIVAIGDSYASGEGNPDVPLTDGIALWADASDRDVRASHSSADRSTVGWPVRVALALEDKSPHTSVTFVDLAASGARIDRGLLGSRGDPPIPGQLVDLQRIVQGRRIDLLLLQIGGNDVGFSRVIRGLVEADPQLNPLCYDVLIDNVWAAAADGVWDRGTRVNYDAPFDFKCEMVGGSGSTIPGLDGLELAFSRLGTRLRSFDIERVLLVEYPDPTGGSPAGQTCDEILGDITAPFGFHEVDQDEQGTALERVLMPLNQTMRDAARTHGWTWVGGVADAFARGHGYCAPWPNYGYPDGFNNFPHLFRARIDFPAGWYQPPGRHGSPRLVNGGEVSWYRTAAQSAALQGPTPRFRTSGTLHPNELGHATIARLVLNTIKLGD